MNISISELRIHSRRSSLTKNVSSKLCSHVFRLLNEQTFPFICSVKKDNGGSKDKLEAFNFCAIFSSLITL